MPKISFDRYYRYADLTRLLHDYAEEYPQLVQVKSNFRSCSTLIRCCVTNTPPQLTTR